MHESVKPDELLPCPFCGSESAAIGYRGHPATEFFWSCNNCHAEGPHTYSTSATGVGVDLEASTAAWNRRARSPQDAKPVAWTNQEALDVTAMRGADTPYEQPMWSESTPEHDIALYASPPLAIEALREAIDLLSGYAEFIRTVPSAVIETHPYLPHVESVIERLKSLGDSDGR